MCAKFLVTFITFTFVLLTLCHAQEYKALQSGAAKLTGPYLGQKPPGVKPVLFAVGVMSTMYHEHSFPSFSPDGKEVFWLSYPIGNYVYNYTPKVLYMRMQNGVWSSPEYPSFAKGIECGEAFFSYDGRRVFFSSATQIATEERKGKTKRDIWITERTPCGWSVPVNIGAPVNTEKNEGQPTVTEDLTLYYCGHLEEVKNNYGIFRSRFINGQYAEPEPLPKTINSEAVDWTPFISRDESYLLWSSTREGGYGSGDLYVAFRSKDDTWTDAINLGPTINERFNERYPYVSPDGKYLFFITDKINKKLVENTELSFREIIEIYNNAGNGWSDIYWVDARIIEELRPKE